jgi:demethylmenaquinone methyltransferase/2-methoxy-6-polyprenyl-1,4-benzoquinol methylase
VYTPSEKLPFHDEAFERVLMVDALHHVADQAATARELWRVLRTGGKLLIVEPDIRQWVVKGIALFEKIALMRSHFLPPEKIVELFKEKEINSQIQIEKATAWITIKK